MVITVVSITDFVVLIVFYWFDYLFDCLPPPSHRHQNWLVSPPSSDVWVVGAGHVLGSGGGGRAAHSWREFKEDPRLAGL